MRKFLITMLLASAAASPAVAGPRDSSDRQHAREERQQAREDRQEARENKSSNREGARSERSDQRSAERPSFTPQVRVDSRQQNANRVDFDRSQRRADVDALRAQREAGRDARAVEQNRAVAPRQRLEDRRAQLRDARDQRQEQRMLQRDRRTDLRAPVISRTPRPGTQPPAPTQVRRTTPAVQWSTNWRNNNRYDWQNHRRHHRSIFHLGFYFDPFGWGYYPYQIGWRLWPSYYSSRYWINDPWMYRLPYAPPGYRWIRYWNDALLVDTWSGEVVDVIPGFFW